MPELFKARFIDFCMHSANLFEFVGFEKTYRWGWRCKSANGHFLLVDPSMLGLHFHPAWTFSAVYGPAC